jgi:pimeloyl-ACP methyl ester carboxylesterase
VSAVLEAHERLLNGSAARRRTVELSAGRKAHIIEVGEGRPVVFLHGSNTSSISFLPLLERLEGVRAIAVDRPGLGLSDPANLGRERFRDGAVEFVDEVLDELGLERSVLAGNSMGGLWSLWYALARPERVRGVVLIGSAPLLPGTRPPTPIRLMATPVAGEILGRIKPNPKMFVRLMASVGERDTIVRYPRLIDALVAVGGDPAAARVNRDELRACISPLGFRRSMFLRPEELRRLTIPTLILWGDHDPVGGVDVARATARAIPDARLELLPAGHVPYLGHPEEVAGLIAGFAPV